MKNCTFCQHENPDNGSFCTNCGGELEKTQQNTAYTTNDIPQTEQPPTVQLAKDPRFVNTTPMLVWSIINLVMCCLPLGIWSLILTVNAKSKPTYELAMKDLKTAKIVNIIGTVCMGLVIIVYVVLLIIAMSMTI